VRAHVRDDPRKSIQWADIARAWPRRWR
jgi:hypothetical protein